MKQQSQCEGQPQYAVQRVQQGSRAALSERATTRPRVVRILQKVAAIALFWSATAGSAMAAEEANDAEPVEAAPDESVWTEEGAPVPEAFAFVVHENGTPYIILRAPRVDEYGRSISESGSEERYSLLDAQGTRRNFAAAPEYLGRYGSAFQALTTTSELGKWGSWVGQEVDLSGPDAHCTGTVEAVGHLVRFYSDGIELGWEALNALNRTPPERIAELTLDHPMGSELLAARVAVAADQDCSKVTWGRSASLPSLSQLPPTQPDAKNAALIERALRRLPDWLQTQRDWTDVRRSMRKARGGPVPSSWERWLASPRERHHWAVSVPGGPTVVWSRYVEGDACGGGCGGYWCGRVAAAWMRSPGSKLWEAIRIPSGVVKEFSLSLAVDLDNDKIPELMVGTGDERYLMRFRNGTYETVLGYRIVDMTCPC